MKNRSIRSFLTSSKTVPYVLILPFLLSFLLLFLYPLLSTISMSFQNIKSGSSEYIGFTYYINLFRSKAFLTAVSNTFLYTIIVIFIVIPIPMLFAVLLNSKSMRFKNLCKSALFIPALTSTVVAGVIFRLMFGEMSTSLMNGLISLFGLAPVKWLKSRVTILLVLELLSLWRWGGVNTVYFLSGLQSIPSELYESAEIDGANKVKAFIHITMPMLKNITVYVLTITIYGGLAMFTESYILFNGVTSPMDMGLTIVGYLYREGLSQGKLGLGSAIGVLLMIITFVFTAVQLRLTGTLKSAKGDD